MKKLLLLLAIPAIIGAADKLTPQQQAVVDIMDSVESMNLQWFATCLAVSESDKAAKVCGQMFADYSNRLNDARENVMQIFSGKDAEKPKDDGLVKN